MTFIHRYATVDGAYHAIQTDPSVRDGHLVAVPERHEVAVVCGAQPLAVDPASRAFSALADPDAWQRFAQGRYRDVVRLAGCLGAAWALEPGDVPTCDRRRHVPRRLRPHLRLGHGQLRRADHRRVGLRALRR